MAIAVGHFMSGLRHAAIVAALFTLPVTAHTEPPSEVAPDVALAHEILERKLMIREIVRDATRRAEMAVCYMQAARAETEELREVQEIGCRRGGLLLPEGRINLDIADELRNKFIRERLDKEREKLSKAVTDGLERLLQSQHTGQSI